MAKPQSANEYIATHKKWEKGLNYLKDLINRTELKETIKWGQPTYTLNNKNVLALAAFKEHFAIWFFNGGLLDDPNGHLHNAQSEKTKAMRQLRFSTFEEISEDLVMEFVAQAIKNQKAGLEVEIDVNPEVLIPDLLEKAFSEDDELKAHFYKLTPGRQREYAEYIGSAKQDTTKHRRLHKIIPMVKSGIGLNDKYQR